MPRLRVKGKGHADQGEHWNDQLPGLQGDLPGRRAFQGERSRESDSGKQRRGMKMKTCAICNMEIKPMHKPCGQSYYNKTCSDSCGKILRVRNLRLACYKRRKPAPILICEGCGESFVPPLSSNGSYKRKTCSEKCVQLAKSKNNIFTDERRKHMSETTKKNGSYKVMHTKESRRKSAIGISKAKYGKINKKNRGKSFNICVFTSPNGVDHETENIADFVRNNKNLFRKEDAEWREVKPGSAQKTSRASNGLRELSSGAKCTWKGWTIRSKNGYEFGSSENMDGSFGIT